ncbi:MAG: DUF4160 domain-containing protein [Saprospiraceae bacterium]
MDSDIEFLTNSLINVINRTKILPDGSIMEIRYMIDQIANLKIIIHPNEHTPPHFHVVTNDYDATLSITECNLIRGSIDSKNLKKIQYWHKFNTAKLVETWNRLRPSDCPVGRIE